MLKFIVFAPLIGAIINGLFGRQFLKVFGQKTTEKLAEDDRETGRVYSLRFGRRFGSVGVHYILRQVIAIA